MPFKYNMGFEDDGSNYGNRYLSTIFSVPSGAVIKTNDSSVKFYVYAYSANNNMPIGVVNSDGSVEATTSFTGAEKLSTNDVYVPGKYNIKIVGNIGGWMSAEQLEQIKAAIQVFSVVATDGLEEKTDSAVEDIAEIDALLNGELGSEYSGTVEWFQGGTTAQVLETVGRTSNNRAATSTYIPGKVEVKSTSAEVLFAVAIYDLNKNKLGRLMPDGSLETDSSEVAYTEWTHGPLVIPDSRYGRLVVRYAPLGSSAGDAITSDKLATIKESIIVTEFSESFLDEVSPDAIVAKVNKNLFQKNIALMGDSLTEQSSLWFTRITSKYFMNTRIEGHGNQRWWSNTQLPNGAVTQVDNLVASDFSPDFIVLEFGTNDIWQSPTLFGEYTDTADKTVAKTVPAMRYCIETLQSNYPDAKILVLMPNLRNNNGLEPEAQKTYRELANAVLDDYGIFRWDMYKYAGIVKSMMAADGVHMCALNGNIFVPQKALYKYSDAFGAALMNLG